MNLGNIFPIFLLCIITAFVAFTRVHILAVSIQSLNAAQNQNLSEVKEKADIIQSTSQNEAVKQLDSVFLSLLTSMVQKIESDKKIPKPYPQYHSFQQLPSINSYPYNPFIQQPPLNNPYNPSFQQPPSNNPYPYDATFHREQLPYNPYPNNPFSQQPPSINPYPNNPFSQQPPSMNPYPTNPFSQQPPSIYPYPHSPTIQQVPYNPYSQLPAASPSTPTTVSSTTDLPKFLGAMDSLHQDNYVKPGK